jgi:hypothetical protein
MVQVLHALDLISQVVYHIFVLSRQLLFVDDLQGEELLVGIFHKEYISKGPFAKFSLVYVLVHELA